MKCTDFKAVRITIAIVETALVEYIYTSEEIVFR